MKRGEHWNQVVHLKDETDVARAPFGELAGGHVRDFIARHGDAAVSGKVESAEKIEQRGLARAARTHEGDEFAFVHVQIEGLQDVDCLARAGVVLVHAADLD